MDTLEIEFYRLRRAKKFDDAYAALERWSSRSAIGPADAAFWKACLLCDQGRFDEAIQTLSDIVEHNRDVNRLCLGRRARTFLDIGELKKALKDYRELLSDTTPRIVDTYHASAKFRVAYIFARLGEHEFENEIRAVRPDHSEWVIDQTWNVSDLEALFAKTRPRRRTGL